MAKYGDANDWSFGTATHTEFDVVESVSAECNFATEITGKNNAGQTTGLILADKRGTATVSGIASSFGVGLGSNQTDPSGIASQAGGQLIVTSVRCNKSNEDFVKYEYTVTSYGGIA